MTLSAARLIVFETSYSAQNGTLSPADVEAAENIVAEAIAESAGEHPAAIAMIARNLYWKLNPLGTVPPSFYQDANFQKLSERLLGIVSPQACSAPISENGRSAVKDDSSEPSDEYWPTPASQSIDRDKDAEQMASFTEDTRSSDARQSFSVTDTQTAAGPFSPETLNAIRGILASFLDDLSEVVTVRAEYRGRELEAMANPARIASERLALIMANVSASPRSGHSDVRVSPVPIDWATEIVSWIYESLEAASPIKWRDYKEQKQQAIAEVAARLPDLIEDFARTAAFQDNFGNTVTLNDAPGWTRAAAVSIYDFIVDGLSPDAITVGRISQMEGITYLQKSLFENVYPALLLGAPDETVAERLPVIAETAKSDVSRREAWKMPWAVASDIVHDLCCRARDETTFLNLFKDWLGLPDAGNDEIRNELISEIVARGREKEVFDEVDLKGQPSVSFVYENWKGEIAVRSAVPVRMTFASNEWHKEKQWLIEAFDLKHNAMRTFAVSGILKFLAADK